MRKYIFWGVLLIASGILWLLRMNGIIFFSWWDVISLWPLCLIWVGISCLPGKNSGYKIVLDLLSFALGIFLLILPIQNERHCRHKYYSHRHYQHAHRGEKYHKELSSNTYQSSINYTTATLNIEAGAAELFIQPGDGELLNITGVLSKWVETKIIDKSDSHVEANLRILSKYANTNHGPFHIKLDTVPLWDFDLEIGATNNNIDLSAFKVKSIDLSSGASNIDLKIGDLYPAVKLDLELGASSITILIPNTMDCSIENESAISNVNFKGFTKQEKGKYFSAATDSIRKGKIDIEVSSGVSSITVERY